MDKKVTKVAIIGGGISGLMSAYNLLTSNKKDELEIYLFEKGNDITKRHCPIIENKNSKCVKCKHCSIMEGIGGAGAFSDGKYNITTEFGGWLQELVDPDILIDYMNKSYDILKLLDGSEPIKVFKPNDELKRECLKKNLYMLQSNCIHFGTDRNYKIMKNLIDFLCSFSNFHLRTNCDVKYVSDINEDERDREEGSKVVDYVERDQNKLEIVDTVIFAIGRVGSSFFVNWCKENGVKMTNNQVDLGIRLELPAPIWEEFENKIYEPKITYRTGKYKDNTRMFCFNGHGEVVMENTDGILTVNGHAYDDEKKKTENTNFAILSTIKFTEPFDNPIDFLQSIAKLGNTMAGGNSVVVQRFGDLVSGQRTTEHRLAQGKVRPTLKAAVPADLSTFIPKRYLDNIIEMIYKLDEIAPGTANYDNLLYGLECKYYSARPETNEDFELTGKEGYYAIGDGTGFTRSLAQAAAQGLMVSDTILKKL